MLGRDPVYLVLEPHIHRCSEFKVLGGKLVLVTVLQMVPRDGCFINIALYLKIITGKSPSHLFTVASCQEDSLDDFLGACKLLLKYLH